jgi:hypothetical protein
MDKTFLLGKENDKEKREEFIKLSCAEKLGWQGMSFSTVRASSEYKSMIEISNIRRQSDKEWCFEGSTLRHEKDKEKKKALCYYNCELGIGWMEFRGGSHRSFFFCTDNALKRLEGFTKLSKSKTKRSKSKTVGSQEIFYRKAVTSRAFIAGISKVYQRGRNDEEWYFEGKLQYHTYSEGPKVLCYYSCKSGIGWIER